MRLKARSWLVALSAPLLWAGPAMAQAPSPRALAAALTAHGATGHGIVAGVDAADLRAIHCDAIEEEPTEFICRWQQRRGQTWSTFSTWLAIDGGGWTLIDDPHPGRDPTVDLP